MPSIAPRKPGENLHVDIIVSGNLSPRFVVRVAIVENGLVTQVKRGENGGRTLHHERVVRVFEETKPDQRGVASVDIKLPKGVDESKCAVVAFVQDEKMRVVGAGEISVSKP